jgi:glucose/arabinose dehydrogenase
VIGGLASPVLLVDPGDGSGRLFVVDQVGLVRIIESGVLLDEPFLDLRQRLVDLSAVYDERGLLGLAFHPDFASSRRFYVYYSAPLRLGPSPQVWDHTSLLSEFTISSTDPNRADPASERVILAVDKPGYNYEGGHIAFGPDGYLYLAMGDSVRHPDREAGTYAQDLTSLLGKILRIDVDSGDPYAIPPDNPFAGGEGRPEIFAYGLRNPYRFSFDALGDRSLFAADVGHAVMEEVDRVVKGGNYGWPVREGLVCFNPAAWTRPLEACASRGARDEALLDPLIAYRHDDGLSAVIGGLVYRGRSLPDLYGRYIFGDWGRGEGRLFAAQLQASAGSPWPFQKIQLEFLDGRDGLGQLLGFGQDSALDLYLLVKDPRAGPSGTTGHVYRLIP